MSSRLNTMLLFVTLVAMLNGVSCQLSIIATEIPKMVYLLENVTKTSTAMASILPEMANSLKNQEDLQTTSNLLLKNSSEAEEKRMEVVLKDEEERHNQVVALLKSQQATQQQTIHVLERMEGVLIQMGSVQVQVAESLKQFAGALQHVQVPDPVKNLNVTEFPESGILAVSWDNSSNVDCVSEYVVEFYNQSECRNTVHAVLKTIDNSINITGILPGTQYTVRVYARNSLGNSSVVEYGTIARTVPGSVSDSLTMDLEPNSLTISWDPPANSTCIPEYKLHLVTYKSESDPSGSAIQSVNTNKTYFVFENLTKCTQYKISVQAVNDIGEEGPPAKQVVYSTYEVPDPVRNLIVLGEIGSLAVAWDHSSNIDCVLKYVVELYNHSMDLCSETTYATGEVVPEIQLNTTKNSVNITHGILPGSPYTVRVYARNRRGNSSVAKHGTMGTKAPTGPPTNVTLTDKSHNTLTFSWERVVCSERGGNNSYEYDLQSSNGAVINSNKTYDMTAVIDGLSPRTNYTFRVKAVNQAGNGIFSLPLETTTGIAPTSEFLTKTEISKSNKSPKSEITTTKAPCPPGERPCADGMCLHEQFFCDRFFDCYDKSDEMMECPCPRPNQWKCKNQRCIDESLVCNGDDDCRDGSDENKCF